MHREYCGLIDLTEGSDHSEEEASSSVNHPIILSKFLIGTVIDFELVLYMRGNDHQY